MTYEELLAEVEYRIKELGGVGKHATPEGAEKAHRFALETLRKIAGLTETAIAYLEVHGECYRAE